MSEVLLIEDDCINTMKLIPDHSVAMVLCDLPYGTTQNSWDSLIDLDKLWEQYHRIVKPNGAIVLTSQGIFTAKLILSNEKHFKYKIVWEKSKSTNFLNAKKQPLRKHEDICVFYTKQPEYYPQMAIGDPYDKGVRKKQLTGSYGDFQPSHVKSEGERYPTDVVYFKTAEAEGRVWHPTQKPVGLARYLIRTYTKENDVILDNCFGSGSFIVASALEGRHAIGIEKNSGILEFKSEPVNLMSIAAERLEGIAKTHSVQKSQVCSNTFKDYFQRVEESKTNKLSLYTDHCHSSLPHSCLKHLSPQIPAVSHCHSVSA